MRPLQSCALPTIAALVLAATAVQAGDVYLGINMSPISPSMARALQLAEDEGVLVDEIVDGSPAEKAGVEAGDVIVAIDDREIAGIKGLAKTIRRYEPGDEVAITVLRSGKRRELKATLGEKKQKTITVWSDEDGGAKVFSWGAGDDDGDVIIKGLHMSDRGFLGIIPGASEEQDGVLIADLVDDGPAKKAGLLAGDVIVALDDETIASGDDLHEFLSDTEPGQAVTVGVARDGARKSFEVTLADLPSQLKLADVYVPGQGSQSWISLDTAPRADYDHERQEVEDMRQELEELKAELQALREELEKKK